MRRAQSSTEQELIDATFSMVALITDAAYRDRFAAMSLEERMEWVARQFRGIGYDTQPMGSSWGVLKRGG